VVREGHPTVGDRISLEEYVRLEHVQIAPRGAPGGYVDDELRARGLERRVTRAFPYFLIALHVVAETDAVLTVSERAASAVAERLGLRLLEPPLALDPYALSLAWHPRHDSDAAHRWLREVFVQAAGEAAGDVHPNARTRLVR
jgi:DNA-binding transcriptional LysR family regulator